MTKHSVSAFYSSTGVDLDVAIDVDPPDEGWLPSQLTTDGRVLFVLWQPPVSVDVRVNSS